MLLSGRCRDDIAADIVSLGLQTTELLQKVTNRLDAPLGVVLGKDLLGERLAVFLVEDLEVLGVADAVDFLSKEPHAEPVYGAHEVVGVPGRHELRYAALHLLGGLVSEGQAQDVGRVDTQFVHYVGVSEGEGSRLARTCTCDDTDAPLGGGHRLPLSAVECRKVHMYSSLLPCE